MEDDLITVEDARNWLRLDNSDNDEVIKGLIQSAEEYIEITTGKAVSKQKESPLAKTACKFLLTLWYDPQTADSDKLQRSIDNLLKALS